MDEPYRHHPAQAGSVFNHEAFPGSTISLHRLIDQGECLVGGLRLVPAQGERGAQQRVGLGWRGAFGEMAAQGLGAAESAQHLEPQRLDTGAQGRLDGLEGDRTRHATADGGQRTCGQLELAPERWLRRRNSSRRSRKVLGQVAPMVNESGLGAHLNGAARCMRITQATSTAGNCRIAPL